MEHDSIQESVSQLISAIDINQLRSVRLNNNGHPVLLEVERIISWLELFNVLLNGLVRLNGLLEKSHVCQEKLAYLIRKSRQKRAQLLSITGDRQSSEGSEGRSRCNSESSHSGDDQDKVLNSAVVDSLADKVASLLQITSPTKMSSKSRRSKTSKPQQSSNTSVKPVKISNRVDVSAKCTQTLNSSTFDRQRNFKRREVMLPKSDDDPTQNPQHSKNTSKLTSWFVEFPEDMSSLGKQRIRVTKDTPEKLPDVFEKKCKHLKERSEKRAEMISTKAMVRKLTSEERLKRAVAECVRENREREARRDQGLKWSQSTPYDYTVKNGIKMKRIFTHKQMRDQTERMYVKLPEVVQREKEMKREESKRVHRVMKQVFNHQMKRSVSHGRLNFPITQNFTVF